MLKKVSIVAIAFMLAIAAVPGGSGGAVAAQKKKGFDVGSVVGGIVGGVGSSVVTNWIFRPPPPNVVYVERPRPPVVVERPRFIPAWTAEWYRACAETYRSFDARTGEYTTYGGEQRFCKIRN